MRILALCAAIAASAFAGAAENAAQEERKAEEVRVRRGIGNFLKKAADGKPVTVAYFGGSITQMAGWRTLTTDWLRKTWPGVEINEINASVGGTGSDLGAFRCGRDVLAHNPDLVFVEFATNDRRRPHDELARSMEGIVRQIWRKDPTADIVFAYTIIASMVPSYGRGVCPPATATMEKLADRYGIPSVDFGPRVAAEVKAGRLVMDLKDAERETAVPAETPERDRAISAELAKSGKILFAKDGVHPAMTGHGYYLQSVTNLFAQARGLKPAGHAAQLEGAPYVAGNLEDAKMVALPESALAGSWEKVPADKGLMPRFAHLAGQIYRSDTPGAALKFKFRGTKCAIYDFVGPDGGQVWITVDGKRRDKPIPRFDTYCTYHRLSSLHVFDGKDGVHEVSIAIDGEQPSRKGIAFRLKDPEKELASPKYNGTNFWPAKIMIVGDLVE